jgi:formylglycine-generating enzyme required for sulfatase activity
MATQGEKYRRLHDFLKGSFRPAEFEIFLKLNGYAEVADAVPRNTAGSDYFFDIVQALDHRGLVDGEFFGHLTRERPRKEAEIKSLEELWLEAEPISAEPAEPRAAGPTRPGPVTIHELPEVINSIGMKLKLIPAGEFLMGSPESDPDAFDDEKPQHRVRITQPFYLGIHQVTRGQFRRFVAAARYLTEAERDGNGGWGWDAAANKWIQDPKFTWRSPGFDQTDDHSVVNVSWNDATAFSDWLSGHEGQEYRLPTEAEWEYACRAGATSRFSFGDDDSALGQYAWYSANSNRQTQPVGEKKPNGFGLYDMHGNVWEWCWDGYGADYYQQSLADDPRGPGAAASRVIRGGGWNIGPRRARSAYRGRSTPGNRYDYLGFRLARGQSDR